MRTISVVVATAACLSFGLAGTGYLQAAREAPANPLVAAGSPGGQQSASAPQPSSSPAPPAGESYRATLDKYCVTCHSDIQHKLGRNPLSLQTADVVNPSADAELWEKVIRKLRARLMPPTGRPRPDDATRDAFVSWLETSIDRGASVAPNPGRTPAAHRLNRVEYTNAIRDLLALEVDASSLLPADDTGYGFDNIAAVLSLSPGLLERYALAAQKISRLAIGDSSVRPSVETYRTQLIRVQEYRMSDDLPAGSRGGLVVRHNFPADGEYVLKINLQRDRRGVVRGLREPNQIDVLLDGKPVKAFRFPGELKASADSYARETHVAVLADADAGLVVRFPVKAGPRLVGVTFQKRTWVAEGVGPSRLPAASASFGVARNSSVENGKIEMSVESIGIEGPFDAIAPEDTPSRRRIFVCRPSSPRNEEPCARTVLSTLAQRAYRRPVTEADLKTLLGFYQAGRRDGSFDTGIQLALELILNDPEFLFRIERDPLNVAPGTPYRISDVDLASRLSFFLWSSIPDDELLDVAVRGQLRDPAVLDHQVRRMLRDARAKALVKNFFGQWLLVRNVQTVSPDPQEFPEFDDNLREAFQRETELFLESCLREDCNVLDLLTANYTFLNERLARHYGIPHVYGSHFRRVTFDDQRRGGILGHGSILTVTSYAHRTSPVVRGKWVLDNLLGTPPPAPPPNVPPLAGNDGKSQPTTVRDRMEQHRENPVCASCHNQMDPLGFALENFDGIGKWRTSEANVPIDPSGAFPDGTYFDSPDAFRKALQQQYRDAFITRLTDKLLTYALGRGVESSDMPAVRGIVRDAATNDYRWESLILSTVKSVPFLMRRSES